MVRVSKWQARTHPCPARFMATKFWPKTKCEVCEKCVVPGNDHKNTNRVGRREVVNLPINEPEGVYLRMRPSLFPQFVRVATHIDEQEEAEGTLGCGLRSRVHSGRDGAG